MWTETIFWAAWEIQWNCIAKQTLMTHYTTYRKVGKFHGYLPCCGDHLKKTHDVRWYEIDVHRINGLLFTPVYLFYYKKKYFQRHLTISWFFHYNMCRAYQLCRLFFTSNWGDYVFSTERVQMQRSWSWSAASSRPSSWQTNTTN